MAVTFVANYTQYEFRPRKACILPRIESVYYAPGVLGPLVGRVPLPVHSYEEAIDYLRRMSPENFVALVRKNGDMGGFRVKGLHSLPTFLQTEYDLFASDERLRLEHPDKWSSIQRDIQCFHREANRWLRALNLAN